MIRIFVLLISFTSLQALAQDQSELVVDINLGDYCPQEKHQKPTKVYCTEEARGGSEVAQIDHLNLMVQETLKINEVKDKQRICDELKELMALEAKPMVLKIKDEEENEWKIRFNFSFSRINYLPTDLKINSTDLNVVFKDVKMTERTSAKHYDPKRWKSFESALNWIDEPTNTFALEIQKKQNIFYITAFHPKYLKSIAYDHESASQIDLGESENPSADTPKNSTGIYMGNTHRNMNWQLGYGREIKLFKTKNSSIALIPRFDVGVMTGQAVSELISPEGVSTVYTDSNKVQGVNASLGTRLEYRYKRISAFVESKRTFAKVEHGILDGKVEYDLQYDNYSFGVGIDLFKIKDKKKKKRP